VLLSHTQLATSGASHASSCIHALSLAAAQLDVGAGAVCGAVVGGVGGDGVRVPQCLSMMKPVESQLQYDGKPYCEQSRMSNDTHEGPSHGNMPSVSGALAVAGTGTVHDT